MHTAESEPAGNRAGEHGGSEVRAVLGLFTLAGLWAAEPLGWIAFERVRTGQASVGTGDLAVAGGEFLVGLFIGLAGLMVLLDERGSPVGVADTGLHH